VDPELKQIRTFQGDVASTIGKQKESLVSIQYAEKSKTEALNQRQAVESSGSESKSETIKIISLILGTFILLAGATAGGWYVFKVYSTQKTEPVIYVPVNRLISTAKTIDIDATSLSRSGIMNLTAQEEEVRTPAGEVTHLNIPLSTREFFEKLEIRPPGNLVRAFDDIFMLGILGGERSSVFVIIKLLSFENAFAGSLAWEERMIEDIGPLFATRSTSRNIASGSRFEDVITRNKDARVLYSPVDEESGLRETLLLYSFFDNNTLIITDSEESLRTLLGLLSSELLSR
jgi:hypothetical protein